MFQHKGSKVPGHFVAFTKPDFEQVSDQQSVTPDELSKREIKEEEPFYNSFTKTQPRFFVPAAHNVSIFFSSIFPDLTEIIIPIK
jgi:hypothetical protein